MTSQPVSRPRTPFPLQLAGILAGVEGVGFVVFAVRELTAMSSARLAMGLTTAVFLLLYGGFLVYCGQRLTRRESWARSPVVLAQLIQLGVAWGFAGGTTVWVAVLLAVTAVVTLVGVFHPASLAALDHED